MVPRVICLLFLAGVITLVLVVLHSFEKRSILRVLPSVLVRVITLNFGFTTIKSKSPHQLIFRFCSLSLRLGFDDQDMERPSFSVPAPHPLVPLLLSDAGVQPVTQVRIMPVSI